MTQQTLYTSQTPIQPDLQDGNLAYTLGCRFTSDINTSCVGSRFFEALTPPSGNVIATLWTNAGVKLAEKAFSAPAAGQWNTVMWDTPVNLTASTQYVISYFTQSRYVRSAGLIPFSNGHLSTSAGFFHAEASGVNPTFPTDDSGGAGYFADVIIDLGTPLVTGADTIAVTGVGTVTFTGAKTASDTVATAGIGTVTMHGQRGGDVSLNTYQFGPCDAWPVIWGSCAQLQTATPQVTGQAVQAASELLYMLSGQRFDTCTVKLRPCRAECAPGWLSNGFWFNFGVWPKPALINGTWYNITCGSCSGSCGCTAISETVLPGPVTSVLEVKVNGIALVNGQDYRVDDYTRLVRLGGTWPWCNDFNLNDDQPNTWSVTAVYGEPVPVLGQMALGELACEFIKHLSGLACALPYGITDMSRQGVSMTFADAQQLIQSGLLNLPICDQFIHASNPHKLQARARVYDIDGPEFRAVGTA